MPRHRTPPSPSRQRDRARHEKDVLTAAERLFASRGFAATTIAEVAQEAGFAVATLYNLFGSKEAILERLMSDHFDEFADAIATAVRAAETPREKLHASVLARAIYCDANRPFFTLFAESYSSVMPRSAREGAPARKQQAVVEELARLEGIFHEMPASKLDAGTRALLFYGATRAYLVERILEAGRPARPPEIARLVDGLLDGLA